MQRITDMMWAQAAGALSAHEGLPQALPDPRCNETNLSATMAPTCLPQISTEVLSLLREQHNIHNTSLFRSDPGTENQAHAPCEPLQKSVLIYTRLEFNSKLYCQKVMF